MESSQSQGRIQQLSNETRKRAGNSDHAAEESSSVLHVKAISAGPFLASLPVLERLVPRGGLYYYYY
jgi:hypothetical protein